MSDECRFTLFSVFRQTNYVWPCIFRTSNKSRASKEWISLMVSWFKTVLGRLGLIWGKNEVINEFLFKEFDKTKILFIHGNDWLIDRLIDFNAYSIIILFCNYLIFNVYTLHCLESIQVSGTILILRQILNCTLKQTADSHSTLCKVSLTWMFSFKI